jgi:DNA-binding NarL/FixJ family response regulator
MSTPIRVLILDDHPAVRAGLEQLLRAADDIDVVALAADIRTAAAVIEAASVNVAVVDLSMPGTEGVEATRRLLGRDPRLRVVVLTAFADRDRLDRARDVGATRCVTKDAEPEELIGAIRAAAGRPPLEAVSLD